MESDRFLNANNLVCPLWNGVDTAGRIVCPDSFYTKRAGCNSAEDRVFVENSHRPQYSEYINLSFGAIAGSDNTAHQIYGNTMGWNSAGAAKDELQQMQNITGSFGNLNQPSAMAYPGCQTGHTTEYMKAMKQEADAAMQMAEGYRRQHW